jgi:hypothetical protein
MIQEDDDFLLSRGQLLRFFLIAGTAGFQDAHRPRVATRSPANRDFGKID